MFAYPIEPELLLNEVVVALLDVLLVVSLLSHSRPDPSLHLLLLLSIELSPRSYKSSFQSKQLHSLAHSLALGSTPAIGGDHGGI